jgi:hypothetical protein
MTVIMLALVAVGVVLLCIPNSGGNEKAGDVSAKSDLSEYKARLENELEDTCSSVEGVGKCRVMITFDKGAENVYKGSQLVESTPPRVSGVTVVCEGGNGSSVKGELTEMIAALFGIGKNRISVMELKK